jgi:hypothetical protein
VILDVTIDRIKISMDILTERRIPMPVKITPTGGYASKYNIRPQVLRFLEAHLDLLDRRVRQQL